MRFNINKLFQSEYKMKYLNVLSLVMQHIQHKNNAFTFNNSSHYKLQNKMDKCLWIDLDSFLPIEYRIVYIFIILNYVKYFYC